MNSYAFGISGYWWLLILFVIIGIGISIITYRYTVPPVSALKRKLLMTLRSLGIALLLFMLFEPVFTKVFGTKEEPKLAVLIDNSVSAGMSDASGNRAVLVKKAIENSGVLSLFPDKARISLFSTEAFRANQWNDSLLKFNGQMTDISSAIRSVGDYSEQDNIQAVLLITDGAFNAGSNPVYDADALGKPVFTIGIGDSLDPKDISVQSIITNDIVYADNPVPVNVTVKITGYTQGDFRVTLLDNNSKIAEQSFVISKEKNIITSIFEFLPKTDGIHRLTAKVSPLAGEITEKNNELSEFVTVLKNKRKISVFAGAPSSDLSFIVNALSAEKGVEVKTYVQKKGAEFYDPQPTQADLHNSDMIFFIGFPIQSTQIASLDMVRNELSQGKPIFFLASQFIDYEKLKRIEEFLPFNYSVSRPQEFLALPDIRPEALSSPIIRIHGNESDIALWNQLPPLFRTETFVKIKPESELISTMKINNVPLKEPLILSRNFQNKKSIAVLGYGIYRWKLIGYGEELAKGRSDKQDLFSLLINNSTKWLSVNQDNKLVNIKTTKRVYSQGEKVDFIGQIYDASYNPIDNATVLIKINTGSAEREISMDNAGNGRYTASLDGLAEGDYFFEGKADQVGKTLGRDKGRFSVGNVSVEYQNYRMEAALLRNLSARTGAKFYTPSDANSFLSDLKVLSNFKTRSVAHRFEINLRNIAWLMALIIACFSAEWFIRKKSGML